MVGDGGTFFLLFYLYIVYFIEDLKWFIVLYDVKGISRELLKFGKRENNVSKIINLGVRWVDRSIFV